MSKFIQSAIVCVFAFFSLNLSGQTKPFPQNVTYPYGYKPATISSSHAQNEYTKLKTSYLVTCGNNVRPVADVKDNTNSESMGSVMLVAAYQGDKAIYDKLLNFYKSKRSSSANNMMAWKVNCGGILDAGSITDADIDVAFSLIIAHIQWRENYLDDAKTIIGILKNSVITDCSGIKALKAGYGYGGCNETNISYYTPAFFRVFAQVTNDNTWTALADDTYTLLSRAANATTGLVPDWQSVSGTAGAGSRSGNYQYDACRVPWRIALDYLWNGNTKAQQWCTKITNWANGKGASNIKDGYALNGNPLGQYNTSAFVGAFAVGAMCNSQPITDSFSTRLGELNESYFFHHYLRLIYFHVLTGNFWAPNLTTDVPSVKNPVMKIYSNQALNQITVEGVKRFEKIEILGINGNILHSELINASDQVVLNVRSLEKGAYLLRATDKAGAFECLKFLR